jgi:SAM-dependent methyltransferase
MTPPQTILDFGAGNGRFISSIDVPGAKLLAIEPDSALGTSIKKFHNVQLVSLSSIPAGSVDFIYSLNVLEHIQNDTETLVELSKKLRPGCRILIFVPAWPHLFRKFDEKIGHFRRYTRKELRRKTENTDLTIDSLYFFDPLGYFAALVFKAFSNKPVLPSRGLVFFDTVIYPASRLFRSITKNLVGKNLVLVVTRGRC